MAKGKTANRAREAGVSSTVVPVGERYAVVHAGTKTRAYGGKGVSLTDATRLAQGLVGPSDIVPVAEDGSLGDPRLTVR